MFEKEKAINVSGNTEAETKSEGFSFESKEDMEKHFAKMGERAEESMKIAREKFNKANKEVDEEMVQKIAEDKKEEYEEITEKELFERIAKEIAIERDKEWKKIVDYIENEAENETDINEIIKSAMSKSDSLNEDCIYTLYQAIILKLQLIEERRDYTFKKDDNK